MNRMKKQLELYVHIPFCAKKCAYCDFLSAPASEERIEAYVCALLEEIRAQKKVAEDYSIETVFVGGGTPSILKEEQITRIFRCLHEVFDIKENAEITMEVNPGSADAEKFGAYKEAGINRISFGLQSSDNEELKLLGRIHTFEDFQESYAMARNAGFGNINVDLISAIPQQTSGSWEQTLKRVMALAPEHISAYSLIIEDGTPFARLYGEHGTQRETLPDEEEERRIYQRTGVLLGEAGYRRYEISNYAREGYECRHNLGYWERADYLGLGLGASSLMGNVRFRNTENMALYLKKAGYPEETVRDREVLSEEAQMEEFIFLGLRKTGGIAEQKFRETFGKSIWECYGANIQKVLYQGLLEQDGGYLRLTERGTDISNYVFAELLYK